MSNMYKTNIKEKVKAGEKVISKLAGTGVEEKWNDILSMRDEVMRKAKEADDALQLMNAKSIVFWAAAKGHTEQAESSEARGKTLGVRYDKDDNLVLVEYVDKTPDPKDMLRKLFGLMRGEQSDD